MHNRPAKTDLKEELSGFGACERLFDLSVNLLGQQGNGHENRRLQVADILNDRSQRLHKAYLSAHNHRADEVRRERKRVEQRQDDEKRILIGNLGAEALERADNVVKKVRVGKHRALGLAGSTRGIDDRRDIRRLGDIFVIPLAAVTDHKRLKAYDIGLGDFAPVENNAVDNDDTAQLGELGRDIHKHSQVGRIGRNDRNLGVFENIANLLVVELRVDRHNRNARARLSEIRNHPIGMVWKNNGGIFFARLDAETCGIAFCDFAHILQEATPGLKLPFLIIAPTKSDIVGNAHRATFK